MGNNQMVYKHSFILFLLSSSLSLPVDRDATQWARALFNKIDQDGNGKVTQVEARDVLQSHGYNPTDDEVASALNNQYNVDFDTFLQQTPTEETTSDAFNLFDMDDDNYLDYFEIGAMFKLYDVNNVDVDPADFIRANDQDGNGMIDFEEFKAASGM